MKLVTQGEGKFEAECGKGRCDVEIGPYKPENFMNEEGLYEVFCDKCGKFLVKLTPMKK